MLSTFLSSFLFFVFASIFRKPSAKKTFIVKEYKKMFYRRMTFCSAAVTYRGNILQRQQSVIPG